MLAPGTHDLLLQFRAIGRLLLAMILATGCCGNSVFQFPEKLLYGLFAFFGWGGEIDLGPSAEIPPQRRIQKRIQL
jgi:hypothetical protein